MTRMVNELLDVARAKNGGIPVTLAPIDLADVMKASIDELAEQHRETRIEMAVKGDGHGDWDADRLMQLITNLVGNAVQHADAHAVSVSLDGTREKSVQLAVKNAGTLDQALQPHLFEPFRTGTTARPGMGLGLYIVDQIARAHGGSVDVRCDDGATCFTVTLPRTT
jgi:signal transduction histidine kinase